VGERTAAAAGGVETVMPPEWAPHERTWMAWPVPNDTFGPSDSGTLGRGDRAGRPQRRGRRPAGAGAGIDVVPAPLDDAWLRDSGRRSCTHRTARSSRWTGSSTAGARSPGRRGSGTGCSEAWSPGARAPGAQQPAGERGRRLPRRRRGDGPADRHGAARPRPQPRPAPGARRGRGARPARHHAGRLAAPRPGPDEGQFGTRGHVDIVARSPGRHRPRAPAGRSPPSDHEVSRQLRAVLEAAVDAQGRRLRWSTCRPRRSWRTRRARSTGPTSTTTS
jgi:agmatine deiminase